MDGRNIQLRESQLARHIHRRNDGLMRGACIGAYGDGTAVGAGFLEQRRPQGVGAGIDQVRSLTR